MIFEDYPTIKVQQVQFDKHSHAPCSMVGTKTLKKTLSLCFKLQSTAGEDSNTTLPYNKYYDLLNQSYSGKRRLSYISLFLRKFMKDTT